ncbi:hypothetical protein AAG570_001804 [Ranatra chinensis]|uniref:Uncharacterized protein n=1 Tax=Ranatra chinensis TaxID=642074 RepID=A0ABD0YXV6_9HEMI
MLATIAYRQGDVSKAETVLMEAVSRLAEKGTASNHNTIVNFSLKLARIYSMNGQDDLAELGFRNCLAIQKKKYMSGENDEETATLWVNTLFWYGKFLACRERFVEAKQCFDSAYTMCTHVKSIDANQVMVMLYNLGEMSFATGDLEDALRHLQNAVILGKSTNSPDLASYYTKIGLIYMHKGIYKEASHWCQWGLDTASRHHDKKASGEAQDCIKHLRTLLDKA